MCVPRSRFEEFIFLRKERNNVDKVEKNKVKSKSPVESLRNARLRLSLVISAIPVDEDFRRSAWLFARDIHGTIDPSIECWIDRSKRNCKEKRPDTPDEIARLKQATETRWSANAKRVSPLRDPQFK
jgi:hypothetical protein